MSAIKNIIESMGMTAQDKITGYEGVFISVSIDIFGCIQGLLKPRVGSDGKLEEGLWFDINRFEFLPDKGQKMAAVDFEKIYHGFEKPVLPKKPPTGSGFGMGCSNEKPNRL